MGLLVLTSCDNKLASVDTGATGVTEVRIDLQGGFNRTKTEVTIDSKSVLNRKLTSHPTLSVAGVIHHKTNSKTITINVTTEGEVRGSVMVSETFDLSEGTYIGARLDWRYNKVFFTQRKKPFLYE